MDLRLSDVMHLIIRLSAKMQTGLATKSDGIGRPSSAAMRRPVPDNGGTRPANNRFLDALAGASRFTVNGRTGEAEKIVR